MRKMCNFAEKSTKQINRMKSSINIIKFLVVLSVILLLATYCISLNDENKWIVFNTPWLSNSFAFAIVGGSFTSLLVVLACEIQKYQSIKCQTEDYIFSQLFSLYSQVTIIHYNTKRQLNDTSSPVPSNLIEEICNRGKMCLTNLASIDYVIFCNDNNIKKHLNQYRGELGTRINLFLLGTLFLKMAISEDKISLLRQGRDELVTSCSSKTHQTLKKIFDDSSAVLSFVENSLKVIDDECKNRYHWREIKRNVITGEEKFVTANLDDYLGLPTI